MDHVGMDLGKRESQIAILTDDGELINMRIRTERHRLVEVFGRRPKAKIIMEASTESEWVARCLEDLGHEVIVADPNYAPMYAQRTRRVKTDRRDAHALAPAGKAGTYRPAPRPATVPGVGPVTATAFVATVDDVTRFRDAHQVEAYLGLIPCEWSSSEAQRRGRITKAGNGRMRWLLVQAAWCILRRRKRPETAALRDWADRIAGRRGRSIAAVALPRRLAGVPLSNL